MHYSFSVDHAHAGYRLDKFLVEQLSTHSRTTIQRLIQQGAITVNEKIVSKHHFLDEHDNIEVNIPEVSEVVPPSESDVQAFAQGVGILYEDDAILVVNKPVGILVHPTQHSQELTLVDFLQFHFPAIVHVGDSAQRPGIVHRLDRAVSGVMVVAKTPNAFLQLKKQFAERTIEKEYRAIVHGVPVNAVGTIRFTIARSTTVAGKMAARPEHEAGRDAWTEYEVLRSLRTYSELKVIIKTGRTHQIRAHLAAIGHPIVGDSLYTSKQFSVGKYPRLFLHAHRLAFTHPENDQKVVFVAPIPAEFGEFLAT